MTKYANAAKALKSSQASGITTPLPQRDKYATSTLKNHQQGAEYNDFTLVHGDKVTIENMTIEYVTDNDGKAVKEGLDLYASFLMSRSIKTRKSSKQEYLKPGTVTQYLSNAKNKIYQRFPKVTFTLMTQETELYKFQETLLQVLQRATALTDGTCHRKLTSPIRRKFATGIITNHVSLVIILHTAMNKHGNSTLKERRRTFRIDTPQS